MDEMTDFDLFMIGDGTGNYVTTGEEINSPSDPTGAIYDCRRE